MNRSTLLSALPLRMLLAAALLLLPVGCGDDDPDTGTSGAPSATTSGPEGPATTEGQQSPASSGTQSPATATESETGEAPTLDEVHAQLFSSNCVPCHGTDGGLSLANDAGLRDRLFASSQQVPGMPQITPGDAAQSYLWHKIANTHLDVGGSGTVMPPFAPLGEAQLDLVLAWIEGGAN